MKRISWRTVLRLALTPLLVWGLYFLRANVCLLYYPAVMVAIAFVGFAVSLFRTPLVEIIARKTGESLDARGVAYCRRVTWLWTVFLFIHFVVTVATVYMSREIWVFYNGFLAYVLMGALFAGEWLYRRRIRRG